MTTQTLLKADIADDIGSDDYTTTIATEITKAIETYRSKGWWFSQSREYTFDTVASQTWYEEGDDGDIAKIIKLTAMVFEDSDHDHFLERKDIKEFEQLTDAQEGSGDPLVYCYYNSKVGIYPIPDDAYTIRMLGDFIVPAPVSDGEADNPWMINAYNLLRAHVVREIALFKLNDDTLVALTDAVIKKELRRLDKETRRKLGKGRIRPNQF